MLGNSHRASVPAVTMTRVTLKPEQEVQSRRKYTLNVKEG